LSALAIFGQFLIRPNDFNEQDSFFAICFTFKDLRYALCAMRSAFPMAQKMLF